MVRDTSWATPINPSISNQAVFKHLDPLTVHRDITMALMAWSTNSPTRILVVVLLVLMVVNRLQASGQEPLELLDNRTVAT